MSKPYIELNPDDDQKTIEFAKQINERILFYFKNEEVTNKKPSISKDVLLRFVNKFKKA